MSASATVAPLGAVPEVGKGSTVAELVSAGVHAGVEHLVAHLPVARADADPEGVHQARVAIRRMRSVLRTVRPLLDPPWFAALDRDLKHRAALFGHVRDLDVLRVRIERAIEQLPERDRVTASFVLERMAAQRSRRFAAMAAELDGPEHAAFIGRLHLAAVDPRFVTDGRLRKHSGPFGPGSPARQVAPVLVQQPWRKLRKNVAALDDAGHASADDLHRLRIRAKRTRYACDAVRPVVGKPAKRLAKRLAGLQDVLGDLHDADVAQEWLREAAGDVRIPRAAALAAGLLVAIERAEVAELSARWPHAWERVIETDTRWLDRTRS